MAVAVAVGALVMPAPLASAHVPSTFWGVDPVANFTPQQLRRLKHGGVDAIRIPIYWSSLQPQPNSELNWNGADAAIEAAALADLEVLPTLTGAPSWAVRAAPVPGSRGKLEAPEQLPVSASAAAGWQRFLVQAVERYGPGGEFWTLHPDLSPRPIHTWQIWNEPNFKYFVTRPDPRQYGRLVELSHRALTGVDPRAHVLLAGLFGRPIEANWKVHPRQAYTAADFIAQMYAATPGIASDFNALALHPYTSDYRYLTQEVSEIRGVLRRDHDAAKGLWITELGWSSDYPDAANGFNQFEKGPRGQANELRRAFALLIKNQRRWHLQRVFWFSLTDAPGSCNFCDGSGLFGPGFKPKLAWWAFVQAAKGTSQ